MTCTVKGCENTAIARGLCPCTTCGRGAQVTPSQSVSQYDRLSLTGTPKWWRSCEPRTWICGGGFGPHKRGSETSKRIEDPWFAGRFFCFVSNLATRSFIRVVGIATSLQERRVDQFDEDTAVLRRLDGACDLDQLAGGDIGIGKGARRISHGLVRGCSGYVESTSEEACEEA